MSGLYRKNAGIIVCRNGKVMLCARADRDDMQWQFPQGGIEAGEDAAAAARRELYEETGLKNVEFVCQMPEVLRYNFPAKVAKHFAPYIGQEQYWFLFTFRGSDEEINLAINPEEIEFKAFEWTDIVEALERIVAFKKDVYTKVVAYFAPFVKREDDERKI